MANAKVYYLDPNLFLATAAAGTAQSPADRTASFYTKALQLFNTIQNRGYETLDTTATSLAVDVYESKLTVSGTMAFTLPNGTYAGQRKRVTCLSAASIPAATLTVTTPDDTAGFVCSSTFLFDNAGQSVEFEWTTGSKWRAVQITRAGGAADAVVIGTTVMTGKNLWADYYCSVTATVASTTTKGIPDGSAVGEIMTVRVSTAGSIPSGTISITGLTNIGGAATTLGTMAATTNYAACRWNGTKWQIIGNTTLVMS